MRGGGTGPTMPRQRTFSNKYCANSSKADRFEDKKST